MTDTRRSSLDELRARHESGGTLPDRDSGGGVELPGDFWDDAELVVRKPKKSVHLRVDAEVLEFFKAQGKGHLTRMNAVLKSYVEARKTGSMR